MSRTMRAWYDRHKKLFWIVIGLTGCYSVAGFVVTPLVVHHLLTDNASAAIHRSVTVGMVRANPYTFTLRLSDLSIAERDGSAFADVKEIALNAQPLASLFKWGIVVKSVRITEPRLRIIRTQTSQFNFSDLLPAPAQKSQDDAARQEPPPRFVLTSFNLENGRIEFEDKAAAGPFQSTGSALTIALNHIDTHAGSSPALFEISVLSEADEKFQSSGQLDIAPLGVAAKFSVKHLQIAKYAPYYGPMINARVTEGALGVQGSIQWSTDRRSISEIECTLDQLTVTTAESGQRLIFIPAFKMDGAEVDIRRQTVQLGRVTSRDAQIDTARNKTGEIDILTALAPGAHRQPPLPEAPPDKAPADAPAWIVRLPELDLKGFSVQFRDGQVTPPAQLKLSSIDLKAGQLTTEHDAMGTLALNLDWAEQGKLAVEGKFGLMPLQATLDVTAQHLDIRPVQPYISEHVHLLVTQGDIETRGKLQVVPLSPGMDLQYSGQAAVNNLQAVDTRQAGDFVKWKSLYLNGLELGIKPFRLLIHEVALTDFFNRLIIFEDGTSNLQAIFGGADRKEPAANAPPDKKSPAAAPSGDTATDIRIQTVTLQGGMVDFSDKHIKPNVRLPMSAIGGRVSGLDTIATNRAEVLLRGMVNENVPMEIKGQINPLIKKPYVDLKLDFAGVDLSPFTPYSGKYLGYTLDKGQLSLNLSYLVADDKLAGQNKVLLKQLTLGETVPSPTATKLPIKLALALLKDRQGNIDLNLPVSGNLDDPKFSIGGIIVKMFVNLIVDIVTSPFKMLGALFGGGEELAYIDFEYGKSQLPDNGPAKLDALAKILYERPGLNLEIQGQVDRKNDIDGLRRIRFEQNLKSSKLKAMSTKGQQAIPLEQIVVTPQERESMIIEAYSAAQFPKPRDDQGQLKTLNTAEMEKLLYTAIVLSDDDLRLLAHERASTAKAYLVEKAGVAIDRLFVIEPKIEPSSQKETLKSRVQFNLK